MMTQKEVLLLFLTALLSTNEGAHGYQYEYYNSSSYGMCVNMNAPPDYTGMTYADGSAFNGEYLLDKCYGLTESYGGTTSTTYYLDTYDPALNAISWSAYNNSDCTGAKGDSEVDLCGVCQGSDYDGFYKVAGCPTPIVMKPPTSIKPGTTVSVIYDVYCGMTGGAHPPDPHYYQVYDASKKSFAAAGYVHPLDTSYKVKYKDSEVTDPWKFKQCLDTYDSIADTLSIKCSEFLDSQFLPSNGTWRNTTNTTNTTHFKCGQCEDGRLTVCPHEIAPMKKVDSVPAGKYTWANYKGPGCTGELSSVDSRIDQIADGSHRVDYTFPIDTCYGWRYKSHASDETWDIAYYKDFYDPVAHTMNYTAHHSPTCDDEPDYSDSGPCDKCVEMCDGGWCEDIKGTIDGTIVSSSMVSGCPAPPPAPPPVAKPPPVKSAAENLAAAKAVAEENKKEAEEKKKVAAEKKALADAKKKEFDDSKKKADEARDAIVAKIPDKKVAVEVEVVAAAAAAGVKLKKLSAPLTAPDATTACEQMCTAAKVDCDKNVLCSAELKTAAARHHHRHHTRHLLQTSSEFTTTLTMPEDATEASSVEDNLKAAGTTPTVTAEDPLKRLNELSAYIPVADFQALKSTTLAASVAKKEADEASVAAVAAQEESTAAEQAVAAAEEKVTAAETQVTNAQSPPPPYTPVSQTTKIYISSSSGRFTAVVLALLACGMFQVMMDF